jgi:hypothetical protein
MIFCTASFSLFCAFTVSIATSFSPSFHCKLPLLSISLPLFFCLAVFLVGLQVNFFCRHINHVGTGVCRIKTEKGADNVDRDSLALMA